MSIKFSCEHCRKEVKAPDEAGGHRGKCPFCGTSNYIPTPVSDDELLTVAPLDEAEERRRQKEIDELFKQERAILADNGGAAPTPVEHREDLTPSDLHHFVVNYCLDIANSQLTRAETHVKDLAKFRTMGVEAVNDFINGKVDESALKTIPPTLLKAFLVRLREQLETAL